MNRYVAGFLFDLNKERVILVQKNRPQWQAGLLNAVGGHIENNELPVDAMRREFREEAGIDIDLWFQFLFLEGKDYSVNFYRRTVTDEVFESVRAMTDENIVIEYIEPLIPPSDMVPNLYWILPLALDLSVCDAYVHTV